MYLILVHVVLQFGLSELVPTTTLVFPNVRFAEMSNSEYHADTIRRFDLLLITQSTTIGYHFVCSGIGKKIDLGYLIIKAADVQYMWKHAKKGTMRLFLFCYCCSNMKQTRMMLFNERNQSVGSELSQRNDYVKAKTRMRNANWVQKK